MWHWLNMPHFLPITILIRAPNPKRAIPSAFLLQNSGKLPGMLFTAQPHPDQVSLPPRRILKRVSPVHNSEIVDEVYIANL